MVGTSKAIKFAYLGRLSSHHYKLLRTLHQEACKFVAQNRFDLVSLLYSDADSHAVDTGLDEAPLLLIATDRHGVE